jgi:hypothetical protein
MPPLASLWQVHSRGTHMVSSLLLIHLMGPILSLDQGTRQLGFGIQPLVSLWQVHLRDTGSGSTLLPIHLMVLQTHINFPRFLPIFPDFLE